MRRLILTAAAILFLSVAASAQFVDRIVRPCASGVPSQASVIVNPNNSGDVKVTTCSGGTLDVNGVPLPTTPGTVTSVATNAPITGGPITTTGTIGCATCVTSAAALTASRLVLGAGSQASAVLGSLGTTTTLLHGNAAGAPTFGAVVLTTDVSGDLPFANLTPATAASKLLGRGSAAGAGDFQEITLGDGVTMTGTTLSAGGAPLACPSNNTVLATATGTVFTSPGNNGTPLSATTEGTVSWAITRAGTVRNLYIRTGTTAKVNTPVTVITVRKNGVDTTLTVTMTQTTTTTTSDTTHSFTVAAGDLITVSLATTGAAAVSTSIAGISFEID